MVINIVTCVVCLVMLIVFRKLDRTNLKMAKLRRYSSRLFDEFKKMAETENRRFNDATIEMDILIKKSDSLSKNITGSIKEIENRLHGLDIEKTNLERVEDDIKVISQSARDVNKQIEFIGEVKESFLELANNTTYLKESIKTLRGESADILLSFNNRLQEKSKEITDEFTDQIAKLKNSFESREETVINEARQKVIDLTEYFERALSEMDQRITDTGEILLQNFKMKIDGVAKSVEGATNLQTHIEMLKMNYADLESRIFSEIKERTVRVEAEVGQSIDKLYDKLGSVEANVNESKSKLIKTFEHEVDKVRSELDNLSIHAISKKDEIVHATRREAEEIKKEIDNFKEVSTLHEQRLVSIKEEIVNYEEQSKIFSRVDTLTKEVNDSIEGLNRMLDDSRKEAQELKKFFDDSDYIKELAKEFDREIRAYQNKKEKMADIEAEVKALEEMSDYALEKANSCQEQFAKIDTVSARIDALVESYVTLETRIRELRDYEDVITKNLDSVNRADIFIQSMDGKVTNIQKVVDRAEKRVDKMNHHLHEVEENTLVLKSRETEIKVVKDKFSELEGLSEHIESRIKQIYAMFQKVETLRDEISSTDSRLQELFTETDRKMKQFSDFIQAVDNNNPILKQVKGNALPAKNINENVIHTVRELSTKGWTSNEISKKLMMDENAVRLIINTSSL